MPTIVHNRDTNTRTLAAFTPQLNPTGLDSGTMRIAYWAGGQADPGDACVAAFLGTQKNGRSMWCTDVQIEETIAGWVMATLTYRGLYNGSDKPVSFNVSVGTGELLYPFDVSGLTYNFGEIRPSDFNITGGGTGVAVVNNPKTGQPWRVRSRENTYSVVRTGISSGTPSSLFDPPTFNSPGNPANEFNNPLTGVEDPLLNIPDGWVRVAFEVPNTELIGDRAFRFWTDTHLWVPAKSR